MADIELVIKINENEYNNLIKRAHENIHALSHVDKMILHGTPLPKGHGRLGDLDALRKEVSSWGMNDYEPMDFIDEIDWADTIIPGVEEKREQTTDNCDNCFNGTTKGGCAVKELIKNKDCKYYMPRKMESEVEEPFINKPCVSTGVCEHDKNVVLDKIRAEIDVARFIDKDTKLCKNANASGLEIAMQIIDKYKAEMENT